MKMFFRATILITAILLLPFIRHGNACFGMDQESITKLGQEVLQVEDLWKTGNTREYYSKAKKIARDIKVNASKSDIDKIAAKLFGNLLSKEVKVVEAEIDDLSAMNNLASYLISYADATSEDRRVNVRLLCKYLGKIRKEIVPNYKPKLVVANVPPPPGVPGMAGMSPEAIKDPVARAKYEAAIRENQENNLMNSRQVELNNIDNEMSKPIMAYIIETFHAGDISSNFFTECINDAGFSAEEKGEIKKGIE